MSDLSNLPMMRFPNDTFSSLPSLASFSFLTLTACQHSVQLGALTGIFAAIGYFFIEVVRFSFRRKDESYRGVLPRQLEPGNSAASIKRTSPCHEWKKGLSWLYSISLGSSCSHITPWFDCSR